VFVEDVEAARARLVQKGCRVVKNEPEFPRCYIEDPFGLVYNVSGSQRK
jgi:hypothetical protein